MMMNLESLVERLGIGSVYWIDDENAKPADLGVEKLIGEFTNQLVANEGGPREQALTFLLGISGQFKVPVRTIRRLLSNDEEGDPASQIEDEITSFFDKNSDLDAREILPGALDLLQQPLTDGQRAALSSIFKITDKCEFTSLSFADWEKKNADILKPQDPKRRSLLIVDIQNTREASTIGGKEVLSQWSSAVEKIEAADKNADKNAILAIALSSKFGKSDEIKEGRKQTSELFKNGTPPLPMLIMAKERLAARDEKSETELAAEAFSHALGRLRAFALHNDLSKEMEDTFNKSVKKAFEELQQLSIEEFLFAVTTTSFYEGVSEIDTLIRLASIAHRKALLDELTTTEKFRENLMELRGFRDVGVTLSLKELDSSEGIQKLRSSEQHDPVKFVNDVLSPISMGDIFELTQSDGSLQYYVVVSNACDLAIRGKDGERKLDTALLLHLDAPPKEKKDNEGHNIGPFPQDSVLKGQVLLAQNERQIVLPLSILDLCWTNTDGNCEWTRDMTPALNSKLGWLPAQKKRFEILNAEFKEASPETLERSHFRFSFTAQWGDPKAVQSENGVAGVKAVKVEKPAIAAEAVVPETQVVPATTTEPPAAAAAAVPQQPSDPEAATVAETKKLQSLKYNLRRVGRLSSSKAAFIVRTFASNIARHAHDHDFTFDKT